MTINLDARALAAGAAVFVALLIAAVLALPSVTAGGVDCGSVVAPADFGYGALATFAEHDCSEKLDPRRNYAIGAIVLGAVLAGCFWVSLKDHSAPKATTSDPPPA